MTLTEPWTTPAIIKHTQHLLYSFNHWLKRPLLDITGTELEKSKALFYAPFILLSHGTQSDPIFNYGNQKALELWDISWEELLQMPSRKTAQDTLQTQRNQLLAQSHQTGFTPNFQAIRINKHHQKFLIENGILWNIIDTNNNYLGQAAVYSDITFLD